MAGTANDIVKIAKAQIGTKESPSGSNNVKYNTWYYGHAVKGSGYPWCAVFVSWCANQAGVSTAKIPKTASVTNLLQFFKNKGRYIKKGNYKPKPGDIMIQKANGASHTGIVISSTSTTFTTIEGNTSNKVGQRTYSLNDSKLSGFGIPAYSASGSGSGGGAIPSDDEKETTISGNKTVSTTDTAAEVQQKEQKEITSTVIKSISGSGGAVRQFLDTVNPNAPAIELYINNAGKLFQPLLKDGVTWETDRQGSPGKLTFTVVKDQNISFHEGNTVIFKVNGKNVFYGYVFVKSRDKEHHISVTAYDQLRYFKNKHTYIYTNKRVDELIRMMANDFNLRVGTLENTGYKIPGRMEDNTTLFDMVQNAIDDTVLNRNKLFVLYDDFGYLTLKNADSMKINDIVINEKAAENFDYKTTIDDNTYNKIQLYYDNGETGQREFYITQNGENISKWGILQLTEKLNDGENPTSKGQAILSLYNDVSRSLTINDAFGDLRVRGGSSVIIQLNLGDLITSHYMFVEKATHTFENNLHTMTLSLRKGSFVTTS